MRVLMVSKACHVAAYRGKLEEMARHAGMQLTLVVPPYWHLGYRTALLEPGHERGYRMVVANPTWNGRHHWHFYPQLAHLLAETQPEIFHVDEEPYDYVTFHALWTARTARARSLFFTWQNAMERVPPPFGLFERFVFARSAAGISGNQEGATLLRRRGFHRPVAVIPQFGVDADEFRPGGSRPEGWPLRIGFVGRLVPEKGVTLLIDALEGLPGSWELVLLGSGSLEEEIEQELVRPAWAGRARLVPQLPSAAMPDHYRSLDLLVLPSLHTRRWKEQFGRALVEAMACGVAVVGSDSGEIPHVIGDAGLVVPEGDEAALRQAIQRLLGDGALRRELGQRGRARVEERFTHRQVAAATLRLYEELLTG